MPESRRIFDRINGLCRWLFFTVLVCAALAVTGRHLLAIHLDKEIRNHVVELLSHHYPDMAVEVQAARRIEGRGIEIRGLTISSLSEESEYQELVRIDEIFASCPTGLQDLMSGKPRIRRMTVHRLQIRATRYPNGEWNIQHLVPLPQFGGTPPVAVLHDSTIELRDLSKPAAGVWALRDINVQLTPESLADGSTVFGVSGQMMGDHFKEVRVEGRIVPEDGSWAALGTLDGLEMSPRLLAALPTDVAKYASLLTTLRARAHFDFRLGYHPQAAVPLDCDIKGRLTEGQLSDERLPYPCTDLTAEIHCTNRQLAIEKVSGQIGPAQLRLSCTCTDYLSDAADIQLAVSIRQLPLNHELFESLPQQLRTEWEKFHPAGTVDVNVSLGTKDGRVIPDLTINCRDVSFAYHKFLYPLQHTVGTVRYVNDRVFFKDVMARAGRQTIYMTGEFMNPGPDSTGWLELRAAGAVPIDEDLIAAMKPAGQRLMRSLNASGAVLLTNGKIQRKVPRGPVLSNFEIEVQNGSVQFDRFPYPIQKINGRLVFNNGEWQSGKLSGHHGSSFVECDGTWTPDRAAGQGGDLVLSFECGDVLLGDDLRNAVGCLDAGVQNLWTSLRPRGTIDRLSLRVAHNSLAKRTRFEVDAEKWDPKQNIDGRTISVRPSWLPLQLSNVTGRMHFSDGNFQLDDIRGFHGDTEITLAGNGHLLPDQRWSVELTQLVSDRIRVDHEVIDALPETIRPALRQLNFQGPLSINGALSLSGGPGMELTAGWNVLLDIENGSLSNQLGLEHIHGGIHLIGTKDKRGINSRGELEIDSVMCHGTQITQIQGPVWIDQRQMLLGTQAERGIKDRIPRNVTAHIMGGMIALEMHILWRENFPFAANISLRDGDIRQFAQGMHAARHNASGRVFGSMQINGNAGGLHTLKGNGQVRLRQADILELPVMVALLSILSLRPADTTAFTSSDIDFRVEGAHLYFDRIDFSGDAISLRGDGWMDLNRQIDLSFYALVGRHEFQVPIVSALLAEASRNILRIQVAGTVDQPHVTRQALPEFNETLQRIFPEAATQENRQPNWPQQQTRTRNVGHQRRY